MARALALLVAVMARGGELGPYLQMLHEAGERAERMKLVIPRELAEKVERGAWSWVEAKDGSGFLPILQSPDGSWAKQVRLTRESLGPNPAHLANAAAHAQTHAMLGQILDKLEALDRKLDTALRLHRDEWIGRIAAGINLFNRPASPD